MDLSTLTGTHPRKQQKRVGRGGKRGTTAGAGTKGQKSRAGASVRAGFRGGDNRIWQLFPKQRGASKKHGNKRPHRKHRYFSLRRAPGMVVNLWSLDAFREGETVSPVTLAEKNLVPASSREVKILGGGSLKRRLSFEGVRMSASARAKIEQAGGAITE